MTNKLILASSSPQRLKLLKKIGINPELIKSSDVDETILKNEKPLELVRRLSLLKANAILNDYNDYFILAADTVVVRGTQILGKPTSKEDEERYLNLLSGKRHRVITGVCLITPNKKIVQKVETSFVKVKKLNKEEIDFYVNSKEWENKSGGYSISGIMDMFVEKIIGSHSNIIGLPLYTTYTMLKGNQFKVL